MGQKRFRAAGLWLVALVPLAVRAPLRLSDLDALKNFYNVTSGADWTVNTNWDLGATSQCGWADQSVGPDYPYVAPAVEDPLGPGCIYKDPCDGLTKWHGVGCIDPCYAPTDGDNCAFGRVTYLNLPSNNLQGTIPDAFFDELVNISFIDISYNSLSGTVPTQIGKLRNLKKLNIARNNFEGSIPTEIANLASALGSEGLTYLDLSHNNLTGNIPSQIAYLEALQFLDLSDNANFGYPPDANNLAMHPPIPTEIGLLDQLQVLNLNWNTLQGFIPTELFECTSLRDLYMRGRLDRTGNQLSGTIPSQIGKLKKLNTLAISSNALSGSIPTQVGDMTILRRLELQENKLSGSMPDCFDTLKHIYMWDTYGNQLIGGLPPSISNATTMQYLYVQNEQTDIIRNYRCGERIPMMGSAHVSPNIPSSQAGNKFNWYVQVAEYFNYHYNSLCGQVHMDASEAFDALSGDI